MAETTTETIEITAKMVSALRERTGAPLMQCKAALVEARGGIAVAEALLRERGARTDADRQKDTGQGYIAVYAHPGNQIVGLVELACTTDFVARSDEFRALAGELAMQVAAMAPLAVSTDDAPAELQESELQAARDRVRADFKLRDKPAALREEIVRKKAEKGLAGRCLLSQTYIRDPHVLVGSLVDDLRMRVREAVYVRRIARWQVGEPLDAAG